MFKIIIIFSLALSFYSCANQPVANTNSMSITVSDYEDLVAKKTMKMESYSGLTNQLTVTSTKIDVQLSEAILARSGQVYEWNPAVTAEEKNKSAAILAAKTEFFVSFFTPERQHNNLNSSKSIWKIYLDVAGVRYEGKATKIKSQLIDLQMLYPKHDRFSSPYKIEFPVATAVIENKPAVLTFTGPNASVKMTW